MRSPVGHCSAGICVPVQTRLHLHIHSCTSLSASPNLCMWTTSRSHKNRSASRTHGSGQTAMRFSYVTRAPCSA